MHKGQVWRPGPQRVLPPGVQLPAGRASHVRQARGRSSQLPRRPLAGPGPATGATVAALRAKEATEADFEGPLPRRACERPEGPGRGRGRRRRRRLLPSTQAPRGHQVLQRKGHRGQFGARGLQQKPAPASSSAARAAELLFRAAVGLQALGLRLQALQDQQRVARLRGVLPGLRGGSRRLGLRRGRLRGARAWAAATNRLDPRPHRLPEPQSCQLRLQSSRRAPGPLERQPRGQGLGVQGTSVPGTQQFRGSRLRGCLRVLLLRRPTHVAKHHQLRRPGAPRTGPREEGWRRGTMARGRRRRAWLGGRLSIAEQAAQDAVRSGRRRRRLAIPEFGPLHRGEGGRAGGWEPGWGGD